MKAPIAGLVLSFALALGPVAWAQGVDLEQQRLRIDVRSDELAIDVIVELSATTDASGLDLLRPLLPVELATVDGVPVPLGPHPVYPDYLLHLDFPSALLAGDHAQVELFMRGTPDCRSLSVQGGLSCFFQRGQLVLTPASPQRAWYLLDLYALDPFDMEVTVVAPSGVAIVAGQGRALSTETSSQGDVTARFGLVRPEEAFGVYVGNKAQVVSRTGATPVLGYFDDDPTARENMQWAVDLGAQLLDTLSALYGPLGLDEVHLMTVPPRFEFGGLGLFGNVFFGAYVIGALDYLLEQGTAHELSHSWWAGLASAADPDQAPFFSEAFAEYSAWLALGRIQGDPVRVAGNRMNAVWYQYARPNDVDVAILAPDATRSPAFIYVTYHKGSQLLRALEARVGQQAFLAALRRLIADGAYGGLSKAALRAAIQAESGFDPGAMLDAWLQHTGYPRFEASSRVLEDGAIEIALASADEFPLLLPIRFVFADGSSEDASLLFEHGASSAQFRPSRTPIQIQIDPDWTGLREIRPSVAGDVSLDGVVDAVDLIELALHVGTALPSERRKDGSYDPLYDLNRDRIVNAVDLSLLNAL